MSLKNVYEQLSDDAKIEILASIKNEISCNQERVNALFYASPQKQLEYFDKALGIKVEDDIWGKWIEIKARRDLWVHNAGIANKIYLDKAKDYSLVLLGKEALIDQKYFSDSVATMKSLVGRIDRDIRNAYKNTELKD